MPCQREDAHCVDSSSASSWMSVSLVPCGVMSPPSFSVDVVVGRNRQELNEFVAQSDLLEQPPRLAEPPDSVELLHLIVKHRADVLPQHASMPQPLPDLRA